MKGVKTTVFVLILLIAGTAAAEFPSVPGTADPTHVYWFSDEADFYIWAQDDKLYLRVELFSDEFFVCGILYSVLQSDGAGDFSGGSLYPVREEGGDTVCEHITADETFLLENQGSTVDLTKPMEIYVDNMVDMSILIDVLGGVSKLVPMNGIWRSADGTLSLYIQKYQAQSAVAVATQNAVQLAAFLDPDISDGFSVDNDLGNQGFGISFVFQSATQATVTVDLPTGTVTKEIALAFPDLR